MEKLLHEIVKESAYYGLGLNKDKCHVISTRDKPEIKFSTGEKIQQVSQETYLGGVIHEKGNPVVDIQNRISSTIPILKQLHVFWYKANVSIAWKLQVYQAVVISKLLYGLDTLQFTETQGQKLDTFQLKGFRKILNVKTTYIDREKLM